MYKILVVDDEPEQRSLLQYAAQPDKREVFEAPNQQAAIEMISQNTFDVVVTDLRMDDQLAAGLAILKVAKEKDVYTQVIVITAWGTPDISVETMRLGAFDYLERNSPGTDFLRMLRSKIDLAIEFREAKNCREKIA